MDVACISHISGFENKNGRDLMVSCEEFVNRKRLNGVS